MWVFEFCIVAYFVSFFYFVFLYFWETWRNHNRYISISLWQKIKIVTKPIQWKYSIEVGMKDILPCPRTRHLSQRIPSNFNFFWKVCCPTYEYSRQHVNPSGLQLQALLHSPHFCHFGGNLKCFLCLFLIYTSVYIRGDCRMQISNTIGTSISINFVWGLSIPCQWCDPYFLCKVALLLCCCSHGW